MAQVNGALITCDRCGAQCFVKTTGDTIMDGGYTRWNNFEPMPAGWGRDKVGEDYMTLCPECNAKWKALSDAFMREAAAFAEMTQPGGEARPCP